MSTLKKIDSLWRQTKEKLRDAKRAAQDMLAEQLAKASGERNHLWAEKRAAIKARRIRYGASVYTPHQGEREKARRRRQLARGILQFGNGYSQ
jgi:hypothetical protein